MVSNLLKSESLSGILCSFEINESIMAISAYPHAHYWQILKDLNIFSHLLESTIQELHQLNVS
jgi:hypothetical protein